MVSSPDRKHPNIVSKEAVGAKLRAIRKKKGFTLKELSAQSGVSLSTLSKAELGHTALSYEKFVAIALALDVDISVLLQTHRGAHTKMLSAQALVANSITQEEYSTVNYQHKFLFSDTSGKAMIPILATIFSREIEEFTEYIKHSGQEFVFVLDGAVRIVFETGNVISLKKNDAAYFDSSVGHVYLSSSKSPAKVLAVCSDRNHPGQP